MLKKWLAAISSKASYFKQVFSEFSSRHHFSKIDSFIERLAMRFHGVPVAKILVGINIGSYLLYFLSSNQTVNKLLYNPVMANFVNPGLFRCAINSSIVYAIASHFERANGTTMLIKIIALSLFQSTILCTAAKIKNGEFYYYGNDAIIRGILLSILLKDPAAKLMISPLPFSIRCFVLATFIILIDLFKFNVPAFGGTGAAILYAKNFI